MHSFIDELTNEQQFGTQVQTGLIPRPHFEEKFQTGFGKETKYKPGQLSSWGQEDHACYLYKK